jgi:predicted RNA-binding Zn-ribbon protein involved in translation (DUF1610 family)
LRRWSALYRLALVAIFGVGVVCALLQLSARSSLFLAAEAIAFTLYVIAGSELRHFRCPRCGEEFIWGLGFFSISFQSHCQHCSLPKYPKDDDSIVKT